MKLNIKDLFYSMALMGLLFGVHTQVQASQETSSVMSNKCDVEKIKSLAGEALVKIGEPNKVGEITTYVITLDTDKMTFGELTKKLLDAGCF